MGSSRPTFQEESFARRHIGPQGQDLQDMLDVVGAADCEEFLAQVVPDEIRTDKVSAFPAISEHRLTTEPLSEVEALDVLRNFASMNSSHKAMLGLGYYNCHMPGPVQRHILENPSWYTAYTPYQAEISQGRLEMLLNFQTMVTSLCGLPMANASLLDEATAAAEAMILLLRACKDKAKNRF